MLLDSSLKTTFSGFYAQWPELLYGAIIVVAAVVVNRIVHAVCRIRDKHRNPIERLWLDAFLGALSGPLRMLVWVLAATIVADLFISGHDLPTLAKLFPPTRNVATILIAAWYLLRVTARAEHNIRERDQPEDKTAFDAIDKLVRALIFVLTVLVVLQTLGISIGGLLAFGGAAGIAFGFAAQSLVANLLGGLTIYASKIFKIGEAIILPGTDLAGDVQGIGWRSTQVLGWDGRPFYIPNSVFNSANLVNHSRLSRRVMSENVLLRYEDFDKVREVVRRGNDMLAERADINFGTFGFDNFGDAALKLHLYAWPQNTPEPTYLPYAEYVRIKHEVMTAIADIVVEEGCELVQPFSHVYLRGDGSEALTPSGPETGAMDTPAVPNTPASSGADANR